VRVFQRELTYGMRVTEWTALYLLLTIIGYSPPYRGLLICADFWCADTRRHNGIAHVSSGH
jgi:hypothetical protein